MERSHFSEKLFIGTSGWSYKHWQENFYPGEVKQADYLEYYTKKFDCVELNASFYHLPKSKTIDGWDDRTPDDFHFCVKMSRLITHQKKINDVDSQVEKFFKSFERMHDKLGPVLVQLPPNLDYDEERIRNFLDLLKTNHSKFRFAFEVRNETWLNDQFYKLLSDYDMGFVIADSGNNYPYSDAVTSDFVYLRLHGKEKLYETDYSDEQLGEFAESIKKWLDDNKEVWVFFNNDFNGYAPKNALTLTEMMEKKMEVSSHS